MSEFSTSPRGDHTVVFGLEGEVMVVDGTSPLAGPSSTSRSTTFTRLSSLPTKVPLSRNQACTFRRGTFSTIFLMRGSSTRHHRRAARG